MARQALTWVVADTHINHDILVEKGIRPEAHDRKLFTQMQHLISPQDLLIHLGDVIFYHYPDLFLWMAGIRCRKILTMGNHDHKSRGWYMRNGFDMAVDAFVLDHVIFSHRPLQQFPSGVSVNVHGHLHAGRHLDSADWYSSATHINVSHEARGYKPFRLIDLLKEVGERDA